MEIYVLITVIIILVLIIYTYLVQAKKRRKRELLLKIIEDDWDFVKEDKQDLSYIELFIQDISTPRSKPDFCTHQLCYIAQDIYNPLLTRPVTNSINTIASILITGSNATGKSTYLRTIGLNAILAQTIYTVCAKSYSASFFTIMSSMSLRDNIYRGESYYMMEIKALKRILDAINAEIPILCCIDEVLRGTNTIERIAASSKILESLAKSNVLCLVASHDLELTYIVEDSYKNYHFQERVDSYGVVCDFKLYAGRSYTRNAINLLKFMGYSEDIIDDAKSRANTYISSGKWT